MSPIAHRIVDVAGLNVFYREAGHRKAPVVLLLHGFPTSSRMFRGLIPVLADHYRVIAPDLPGFGFTDAPDRASVAYTFEHLTDVVDRFTEVLELTRFTIFVFDYGAPIGFRLALRHPERITAIITQNGNAYEEGLSEGWNPIQAYWREPTQKNRAVLRDFLRPETTKWQYTHGVADESLVAPESYTLDSALLARPGNDEIQLDLFLDYASNVALYPISKLTYGRTVRRCLRSGARTIRFSCPRARKRSSATYRMPRSVSTTRAISRWRRMARRSPPRLASSLSDCLVPKQLQPDRREPYLGGAGQTMTVPPRRSSLAPGRFTMSTDIISLTDVGGPPARTGAVVSVQVGQVAPLGPDGVASGFVKAPVAGPVAVGRLGMAGDAHADLRVHGGPEKAVNLYPSEHYASWRRELPEHAATLIPGGFGENLTTLGLDEDSICIGDVVRTGSALLQVTQPRQPCFKLALRFADPRMPQMMLQTGRSGWYARVLEDGIVERLSSIIVAERPNAAWPVSRLVRLIAHHSSTLEDMVELSELPGLAAHWRRTATAAVEQAALRHLRLAATTGSASTPSTR